MKERLLVTGATGFLGRWTLRHWHETYPDVEVWATGIEPEGPGQHEANYVQVDLCERDAAFDLVRACNPTEVVHLAGLVGDAPLGRHLSINVLGTNNFYCALAETQCARRIIQASSAAVYGLIRENELPVTEKQPHRPVSTYALSKLAQDYLALSAHYCHSMPIVLGCIFNVLGPGQPDSLVPMTFVSQLKRIENTSSNTLRVGNTASRRDFVDVRDVVHAFDLLLQHGRPGEVYNIGTGQEVSIEEMIRELRTLAGVEVEVDVVVDRVRAVDVPRVRADISKIAEATGWRPAIGWRESLKDMWDDYAA